MSSAKKPTFEDVYNRMTADLNARAARIASERETLAEMRKLAAEGLRLAKSGNTAQARAALRKAEKLKKKLPASSTRR